MRLAVLVVVLAGCGASLREKADDAMKRRDYRQAAELYDQALVKQPNDPALLAKRTAARHGVLGQLFVANQAARRVNDRPKAFATLAALLDQRDAWAMQLDERLAPALAAEVGMAGNDIAIDVDYATQTVGPLAGERVFANHAALLAHADFGGRAVAIHAKVQGVGRAACGVLAADADTPFWRWIVDRYCAHWGEAGKVGAVALPALRRELSVLGAVQGLSVGEAEQLARALVTAFRTSAWYAPTGEHIASTTLSGAVAISFTSRPINQSTTYDEEVPYTDYETSQESYQEPYDETESYSEQVPYTETETSSETCQRCDGTDRQCEPYSCPKTHTVTKYRTEWKTRTVTKHRTAWRTVTNPVTRYRTVTHPYDYWATEITGSYATQLALAIDDTAELAGVRAATRLTDVQSGIEHDVTFAPASVYPSRANLPSRDGVLDGQRRELQRQLVTALDARYAKLHCAAATYDREAAATCAYLDHRTAPPAVHATLRTRFGADEAFLAAVLTRDL